jgi:hypothetical protein
LPCFISSLFFPPPLALPSLISLFSSPLHLDLTEAQKKKRKDRRKQQKEEILFKLHLCLVSSLLSFSLHRLFVSPQQQQQ